MFQEAHCLPSDRNSEPVDARLEGTEFYRKMRTPSQPALLLGSDHKLHVVKWSDPSQRPHVLASEVIGHALLTAVGLPVAPWRPLFASDAFIEANPEMWPQFPLARRRIEPGLHFASEFLGIERTGTVFELLPTRWWDLLCNPDDLLGAYIFDIWTGARNPRKVLFRREDGTDRLRAFFVDNSELFGGSGWRFSSRPACVLDSSLTFYARDWDEAAVLSWITKIRIRSPPALSKISNLVPPFWYGGNVAVLADVLSTRLRTLERITAEELQRVGRGHLLQHYCARF